VEFPISDFYSAVSGALNKGKFRKTGELSQEDRIRKSLQVNDVRSYSDLLKNTARIQLPDSDERVTLSEFVSRSDYFNEGGIELFLKCLFMSEQRSKYLSVIPTVQYEGKSLGALSIGQRGTVYVVIKLATSAFGVPLVYDQPEDDLDQKFISEELVLLFRGIKKYRQIIIVTHNANLVVNTDAEQVIVASNTAVGKSESISYYSGSIENTGSSDNSSRRGIREQACAILEGGKEAFRQRERRYGLSTAK
jgi:ABC-type cobalamin/Fe3+-siderophores transport system ATPase subunit